MQKSEKIENLAKALSQAQGEMGAAKMDTVNPFFKSKYANLGSVIESVKVPLKNHGLSYSQFTEGDGTKVTVTTALMHESGEWISSEVSLPLGEGKGNSLAQQLGIIATYLRRYALSAILGVYTDEDTDGNDPKSPNSSSDNTKSSKPPKTAEKPEPPSEEVVGKHKEIIELCTKLGGSKNKELMKVLEKHLDNKHDPTKVTDMKKLEELMAELTAFTQKEEPENKKEEK
jgi:hypothetical protein